MKHFGIVFFLLVLLVCTGEAFAGTNNGSVNNTSSIPGTNEKVSGSEKEKSTKYNFSLFNFFYTQEQESEKTDTVSTATDPRVKPGAPQPVR